MKILVCGGRNFNDMALLERELDSIAEARGVSVTEIVSGLAHGADMLAKYYANSRKIQFTGYPADWDKDGRAAGFIRNAEMLRRSKPDLVVAFPGGTGTAHMVRISKSSGYVVHEVDGD